MLAERVGDEEGLKIVLRNLGDVCDEAELGLKALGFFERALPLVEKSGDREALGSLLDDLGRIQYALGNDELAIAATKRALEVYESDRSAAAVKRLKARLDDLLRR